VNPSIILGIGSGRCGTFSLAHVLNRQPSVEVSHEDPPLLPWRREPGEAVIRERFARFRTVDYPGFYSGAYYAGGGYSGGGSGDYLGYLGDAFGSGDGSGGSSGGGGGLLLFAATAGGADADEGTPDTEHPGSDRGLLPKGRLHPGRGQSAVHNRSPVWQNWLPADDIGSPEQLPASITIDVDAAGNLLSITDSLGNRASYTYDSARNATRVTDPTNGDTTTFAHDAAGNLVELVGTTIPGTSSARWIAPAKFRRYCGPFAAASLTASSASIMTRKPTLYTCCHGG